MTIGCGIRNCLHNDDCFNTTVAGICFNFRLVLLSVRTDVIHHLTPRYYEDQSSDTEDNELFQTDILFVVLMFSFFPQTIYFLLKIIYGAFYWHT